MRLVLSGVALVLAGTAVAEEYDYELFVGFNGSNTEVRDVNPPGILPFPLLVTRSESETDVYDASFRWYFDGLSDEIGPRDRAAFTDRATFAEFALLTGTLATSASIQTDDQVQQFNTDDDLTGYALAGRKVFDNWFLTGSASVSELDTPTGNLDQSLVTVGVGRYIAQTTSLSLSAIRASTDFAGTNDIDSGLQVDFNHIGELLGSNWQYAVDVSASNETFQNSNGSYQVGLTLYPTKNFGFGLEIEDQLGGSDIDATRYTLGANWFVTPQLQFEFSAGSISFDDPPGVETDSDQYSIQARYRF